MYKDLRGFIKEVDELGVLRRVNGADPKFELGGITEVAAGSAECPALLFDRIKGYEKGVRVFTNATTTPQRAALALGIDPSLKPLDALKAWMKKRQTLAPQRPVEVDKASFMDNVMRGRNVDLAKLPAYCQAVAEATGVPIPAKYPVVGRDAFRTATGVHAAAIAKAARKGDRAAADAVYSGVPASLVGREQEIEIGPLSGKWNVIFWLEKHGLQASEEVVDRILARGKQSATTLTAAEILEVIGTAS